MASCSLASRSGAMPNRAPTVRCAIYTRKSTEEGLDQEFNSLHAQREAGEAYIKSQKHLGWTLVSTHYDDGGFTGGNLDRPALQQLLEDIDAHHIDCVVVYKVDRLSRLLHCKSCRRPMVPTYTAKPGRRYRYYVCQGARQNGWSSCPTQSVPARTLEDAVVDQLRKFRVAEADGQPLDENSLEFVRDFVKEVSYAGMTGAVS